MIIKYSYRTGNPVDTLFNARTARESTFDDFDGYDISSTGHHILVWRETEPIYRRSFKAMVYDYDVRRNYVKPVSDSKNKQMIPTYSPDGRMCAYVVDNNIWIRKFDYDTEVQVTKDGELNKILNGITDWVYEEEFAVTNLMAWSPDSEYLTYVRFDESEVPEYSMQMWGNGLYPGYYNFKYPKAGENNSKVTVHSYSVATKDIKELKVPVEGDYYIPRITFTTNSDQLAVMTLNRQQNVFNMYYVNPKSGVSRLILRDENKCYVDSEWLTSIHFNPSGFTYVSEQDGYSHIYLYANTPAVITVNETKSKKVLRVLQDNAALREKLANTSFSKKEFFKVHTASDIELNAWIVKPVDFDESKKYPVLMVQYSGPNSQQVLDKYGFDWEHYLAANGIIVVSVDGRGTGARGEAFRKCTYLRMGDLESRDQVEAAQALGKLPYVDAKRIAIWGWSFGGYNTLMSMSVGNGTFKAGIAVAPPTDWKYYDSVYTERFMRTPKENFSGYAATSPIRQAKDLQGKLLLVHGTADDNVHFQQTMDYAEALVQAGKQFDMQVYKDRNHSIYGGNTRYHLYTRMSNFLLDNL